MYALFFSITMLLGKPSEPIEGRTGGSFNKVRFFKKQHIPDKFVEDLRSKYFNR
jgi:hypothetical protein